MDREALKALVRRVKGYDFLSFGELQAKRAIIEPIFDLLGWDTSDPNEVLLEYGMPSSGRVDYAFQWSC